jgi:hypothetical protein
VRPVISIDPGYTVLQVINANLDLDPEEEQVIAVKRLADVSSPIRIIVADAESGQGGYYYASWEADTLATDTRVFSLSVKDIIGDHGMEIVAAGMNDAGKVTLDALRAVAGTGKGLTFRPVFQLVADEISIEETDRPDTYSVQGLPAPSFPIQVFLRDTESQNVLDLVSVLYTWDGAEGRYVPGAPVKIPGANVQQEKLSALYLSTGEDAFERFISGSWIQLSSAAGSPPNASSSILAFDPVKRQIAIATGNTEEVYVWQASQRKIYKQLLVVGENVTVPLIRLIRRFSISADAPDSITVTIGGDDFAPQTTFVYTRLTDDIRARLLDHPDSRVGPAPVTLRGAYTGSNGLLIDFGDSSLAWSDGEGRRPGSYALFTLGSASVLTWRIGGDEHTPARTESWIVSWQEKKGSTSVTRTLGLAPIRLTVSGYEGINGSSLVLTQTASLKGN